MGKPFATLNTPKMARSLARKLWISELLDFPAVTFEQNDADSSDGGFGDDDGPKDAAGVHSNGDRQEVGQRNFQEPEAEEIHNGGRDGVASAVEGLEHDHAVGVADVAVAENTQAGDSQRDDERIAGEETNDRFGEDDEEEANDAEKDHVVKAGAPDGSFGALGLLGAQVLADEGGGGVAETPARHEDEDENADGDGVAGEGAQGRMERGEEGEGGGGERGEGGSGHAEVGERPPGENEARVEDEIDDVGDPEQTHGDSGVTGAAEDGVVEKEHHDGSAAAEGDACITGADGNDLRGCTHQPKQIRPVKEAGNADERGDCEADGNSLNAGNGCASGIFFADATSDHGSGGKAEAEADSHDEAEERFSEANGGDGVGTETADPENVDDGEKGFQDHFHDHGNGEEKNRAIEIAGGEVLVRAAEGFANGAPKGGRRRGNSCLFQ